MKSRSIIKGIGLLLLLWLTASFIIRHPAVPYPHTVVRELVKETASGSVFLHILASLLRIAGALLPALAAAVPLGILAGRNRSADSVLSPLSYLLYPVPKIAFLPVFMVLFGVGNLPKILLVAFILFFPLFIAVRDGVRTLPREYDFLTKVFRLSRKQVLLDIILPGIIPSIFSSLRISIGISLAVLFFSENFAATWGIGHYIMNSWVMVNYQRMYVGIIFLSILGVTLYMLLDILEEKLAPWAKR